MYRLMVKVKARARDGKWVLFLFFAALKSDKHFCGNATCGNVVCDVLWLSLWTEQPHPLGGSRDRGHETT